MNLSYYYMLNNLQQLQLSELIPMKDVPMTTTFLPAPISAILLAWLGSRRRNTFSKSNPGMGRVLGLR